MRFPQVEATERLPDCFEIVEGHADTCSGVPPSVSVAARWGSPVSAREPAAVVISR